VGSSRVHVREALDAADLAGWAEAAKATQPLIPRMRELLAMCAALHKMFRDFGINVISSAVSDTFATTPNHALQASPDPLFCRELRTGRHPSGRRTRPSRARSIPGRELGPQAPAQRQRWVRDPCDLCDPCDSVLDALSPKVNQLKLAAASPAWATRSCASSRLPPVLAVTLPRSLVERRPTSSPSPTEPQAVPVKSGTPPRTPAEALPLRP
jgi:hypothetical protein